MKRYYCTTEIRQTIKTRLPKIQFQDIASEVLSERYVLSLVLCGDTLSRRINGTYSLPALKLRQAGKKNYSPNVLSFPLGEYDGEIFLNVRKAEREAKATGISARNRIAFLFVHGCLHLQGLQHGKRMEAEEKRILRRVGIRT